MLRKEIEAVEFSAEDAGKAFAKATDDEQRAFLLAWLSEVDTMDCMGGSWAMQCRAIVDDGGPHRALTRLERKCIASMLDVLVDHLRDLEDVLRDLEDECLRCPKCGITACVKTSMTRAKCSSCGHNAHVARFKEQHEAE